MADPQLEYGVELADLFGKPLSYALPEVERRITEALLQDDRITAVHDFTFTKGRGGRVTAAFTVESVFGSCARIGRWNCKCMRTSHMKSCWLP